MNWKETRAEYVGGGRTAQVGRTAVVMEFYAKGEALAGSGEAILDLCLEAAPDELKGELHVLSTNQYKKLTRALLRRMRKELSEIDKKPRMYAATSSPDCVVGDYSFELDLGETHPLTNNLVFVALPLRAGEPEHVEGTVQFFEKMLGAAPFWGAIAGYGFDIVWGREFEMAAMPVNFTLSRRYQGVLVRDRLQSTALPEPRPPAPPRLRIPSVAWLNYFGPPLLDQLGGKDALEAGARAKGLSCKDVGAGVLVRACQAPPAGDVNRQEPELAALRALHELAEPVVLDTWFRSAGLLGVDHDTASVWLHRFES